MTSDGTRRINGLSTMYCELYTTSSSLQEQRGTYLGDLGGYRDSSPATDVTSPPSNIVFATLELVDPALSRVCLVCHRPWIAIDSPCRVPTKEAFATTHGNHFKLYEDSLTSRRNITPAEHAKLPRLTRPFTNADLSPRFAEACSMPRITTSGLAHIHQWTSQTEPLCL